MQKCVSFLPAATQMIYDMNLQDHLHGVTFECPSHSREEKPVLVRCILEGKEYSSIEIDRIYSASKAEGRSLYYVEEEKLSEIAPDIVFTQDSCEVCLIDTRCTAAALRHLRHPPRLVSLSPDHLEDVFACAVTIAQALGKEEIAYRYLAGLQSRIDRIIDAQRSLKLRPKKVSLLEWIDPLYNCGHWIPEQLAWAGGIDMLSHPGGDSVAISWDKLLKYNPEVIVIAPCGFDIKRTIKESDLLTKKSEWKSLRAVQSGQVFIVDFDLFTQPSASTLVDGIEVLASLFHPELGPVPEKLAHRFKKLEESVKHV